MSFWAKSTGVAATATMDQEGAETGKLVRIPDGTYLRAHVVEVELSRVRDEEFEEGVYEYDGFRLTWAVAEEGEFQGVNVRQSLRVMSQNTQRRDQALDVLAFMDLHMNKGQFMQSDVAPDAQDIADAFGTTEMVIKVSARLSQNESTGAEQYTQWVAGCFRKKPESHESFPTKEAALASATDKIKQQVANKANGPANGPKTNGPAAGPKPTGPAAGPKTNGPATNGPATNGGGESAAEKRARIEREQAELAAQEEAERQAEEARRMASDVADEMDSQQQAADGVENNDDGLGY